MNYSEDFQTMIKKYNDEIKKMNENKKKDLPNLNENIAVKENNQDKANSSQNEEKKKDINNEKTNDNTLFEEDYTLPNIEENQVVKGQIDNLTGKGNLSVRVFTAKQAAPVEGALVVISLQTETGETLIRSGVTDSSGEIPEITLPTVNKEESLKPGVNNPYAAYRVRISADGYFTIDSVNVPIFDGESSTLPVEMLPLPKGYNGKIILESLDTGAIGLN